MLGYSYQASFHDAYGRLRHAHYRYQPELPYKSHRTYLTNNMESMSCNIMQSVINSLGGEHTQAHMHTYRHSQTEAILRNQAHAWFKSLAKLHYQYYWQNKTLANPTNLTIRFNVYFSCNHFLHHNNWILRLSQKLSLFQLYSLQLSQLSNGAFLDSKWSVYCYWENSL